MFKNTESYLSFSGKIFHVSSLTCNRRGIKVSISRIWADSSIKMLSYWEKKKSKDMSINTVTQMKVFIQPTKRKYLLLLQSLLGATVTAGFHFLGKISVLPSRWSHITSMADLSVPVRAYTQKESMTELHTLHASYKPQPQEKSFVQWSKLIWHLCTEAEEEPFCDPIQYMISEN